MTTEQHVAKITSLPIEGQLAIVQAVTAVLYCDTGPAEIVVAGLPVGGRSTSNLIGRG